MKDLKEENLEYKTVGEFLADLKRKFREEDNCYNLESVDRHLGLGLGP